MMISKNIHDLYMLALKLEYTMKTIEAKFLFNKTINNEDDFNGF